MVEIITTKNNASDYRNSKLFVKNDKNGNQRHFEGNVCNKHDNQKDGEIIHDKRKCSFTYKMFNLTNNQSIHISSNNISPLAIKSTKI